MCQVKFVPGSMLQKDSRFYIEADMLFVCRSVADDASYMFVPVLYDETHRLELPSVVVAGAKRYRALKGMMWRFFGRSFFQGYKVRKILKAANPSWINYPYHVYIDYEDWMSEAEIILLTPA